MKSICITGHRPDKLPWGYNESGTEYLAFERKLRSIINARLAEGYTHFISGMALGVDLIFAEIILELRESNSDITLECALPCPNQTLKWKEDSVQRYEKILSQADKVTTTSPSYTRFCMLKRNEYMVNSSDAVIAVWNGIEKGGTWYTVKYARKKEKTLYLISV